MFAFEKTYFTCAGFQQTEIFVENFLVISYRFLWIQEPKTLFKTTFPLISACISSSINSKVVVAQKNTKPISTCFNDLLPFCMFLLFRNESLRQLHTIWEKRNWKEIFFFAQFLYFHLFQFLNMQNNCICSWYVFSRNLWEFLKTEMWDDE